MIEGEGAVDDIVWTDLGHQVHPLLEAEVPHVLDVASLGQPGSARRVDIAGLVCDSMPKNCKRMLEIIMWFGQIVSKLLCAQIFFCKNNHCC